MALAAGTRLGSYEVIDALGAGGMGEVYRARDTRLGRSVAIKILPAHLSEDPERRERFEREARLISSLSHPHICVLYDVGEHDGITFLVMEYVRGRTLAERLEEGPLPVEQALAFAIQMAEALDRAHREGIIHRDLKPGNVMLARDGVKLLDFGLAKLRQPDLPEGPSVATASLHVTEEGIIVGTVPYMAPEQLEGRAVDARTDIFALGCVLYEMVSGRRPFAADSKASLIAAILTAEPPALSSLRPLAPPLLERVVKKCLAKDPDERWQTARDLAGALRWIVEDRSQPGSTAAISVAASQPGRRRERIAWAVAALAALLAVAIALLRPLAMPVETPTVRFTVPLPPGARLPKADIFARLALSPDGKDLVFATSAGDHAGLWLRPFEALAPRFLPGTEGGFAPFWSPDGRFIAYHTGMGKLMKVESAGTAPPMTVADAGPYGPGAWNREGTILFARRDGGLSRVSADGSDLAQVTSVSATQREMLHLWPQFLADGRRFLFLVVSSDDEGRRHRHMHLGSIDSPEHKRLADVESRFVYAPSGHMVYARAGTLLAQPFDLETLRFTGESATLADRLSYALVTGMAEFSVSDTGVVAYHGGTDRCRLEWYDRGGRPIEAVAAPDALGGPRLSPDGKRVAFTVADPRTGLTDVWIHELERGTADRFTSGPALQSNPIWSWDGRWLTFSSTRYGPSGIFRKRADGAGHDEALFSPTESRAAWRLASDESPDGRLLVFTTRGPSTDVWLLPLTGDRKPVRLLDTPFNEDQARFSPDGKWLAFSSDDTGRREVYVAALAEPGARRRVSREGGTQPSWRRDGRELYYLAADGTLTAVALKTEPTLQAGAPVALFRVPGIARSANAYDASPDGSRFLVTTVVEDVAAAPITVVLNWPAGVRR